MEALVLIYWINTPAYVQMVSLGRTVTLTRTCVSRRLWISPCVSMEGHVWMDLEPISHAGKINIALYYLEDITDLLWGLMTPCWSQIYTMNTFTVFTLSGKACKICLYNTTNINTKEREMGCISCSHKYYWINEWCTNNTMNASSDNRFWKSVCLKKMHLTLRSLSILAFALRGVFLKSFSNGRKHFACCLCTLYILRFNRLLHLPF